MSIKINLNAPDNASLPTSLEGAIKENNETIETALARALSRDNLDGDNFMLAELDMNGFRIINSAPALSDNDLVTRGGVSSIKSGEFRKNPVTNDLEYRSGDSPSWIIIFTNDELRGPAGISGDGTGDLIAINNLSDVDDASVARDNLGLTIGTDVSAYNADLDGFDPDTKADLTDSRFTAYKVSSYTSSTSNNNNDSTFYTFSGTSTLTLESRPMGTVLSVYVSSGTVTVARGSGVSLRVSGSSSNTNATITAGGFVSIVAVTPNLFVVSGSNVSAA